MTRVLVTGGRDFNDSAYVFDKLDMYARLFGISVLCQGGASGADSAAHQWALSRGVPSVTVEAEWDRYGTAAGRIRNQKMLTTFKPDVVIAFPGGPGTRDMVGRARGAKLAYGVMRFKVAGWTQNAARCNATRGV